MPGRLGGGGALLRLQGVFVLGLARNAVAVGHALGSLEHRHIDVRRLLQQGLILEPVEVHMLVLDQRNALQSAPHGNHLSVDHHLFGRGGDRHQARGALAVQTHARHGGGQAGGQRDLARDIGRGRALLQGRAHHHILDLGRIAARALDGVAHGVGAQLLGLGVIEGPAIGAPDRGAGGRDDDGFTGHVFLS